MLYSVPTGQLACSSRAVVKTVLVALPPVNTSGQVGEDFVLRVRQLMRPSPSRSAATKRPEDIFNVFTQGLCYCIQIKIDPGLMITLQLIYHKKIARDLFSF